MEDRIKIQGLKLETVIGVPDEEREASQIVAVDVEIVPKTKFDQLADEIDGTVDYFEVTVALKRVAGKGERKLIETLANDLAEAVLEFPNVESVGIEIRKFILPETEHVAVSTWRSR